MMRTLGFVALAASLVTAAPQRQSCACRYIPGDAGWPTAAQWDQLNTTVNGRLIATNPVSHVCHDPTYDEEACNALTAAWGPSSVLIDQPAEAFAPYFLNQSCVPQTERSRPCELGNYPNYSIDVRTPEDAAAGVAFAARRNIRLTIMNTGHDWLGKSSGMGSLSLWMRNRQDIELFETYNSSYYTGPAIKIGSGVTGGQAVTYANQRGYRFLSGSCPTVGAAGGFTQGGGYGLLSGIYGLSAYNVLEWEVVTANGTHLVATPTQNEDLYYALSGGGGGTYGVVMSMTTRLFPEQPVAIASFSFNTTSTGSLESYWAGIEVLVRHHPSLIQHGLTIGFRVRETVMSATIFATLGGNPDDLNELLQPLVTDLMEETGLTQAGLGYTMQAAPQFGRLYLALTAPLLNDTSPSPAVVGSRFFSRQSISNNSAGITDALRIGTTDDRFWFSCTGFDAANPLGAAPVADNAVNEGWLNSAFHCFYQTDWTWTDPWPEVAELQSFALDVVQPALDAATPGDGGYLNEGNHAAPNYQENFYGDKYDRLRAIKETYDPLNIFYATTAVGSEAWEVDGSGRLCRARPSR
ncbi:hypothetical protein S7711_05838 [Stachybotrys chartarum IBT 7711]|uniref:FAD-binding PCMH-type domain-containing protein n=1 Tax=Stachybotrys chartarum (strain CBS 109288 / IBT 7711) TaxID=1280523 RepID=A0A084AM76_STACB|nr:hypothetical protein S7711_05838 [Stachybotrys chartarum IBT 7711]